MSCNLSVKSLTLNLFISQNYCKIGLMNMLILRRAVSLAPLFFLMACSSGPSNGNIAEAIQNSGWANGGKVTIIEAECIPASEGPERYRGIGHYCEVRWDSPRSVGGPFSYRGRVAESGGRWMFYI